MGNMIVIDNLSFEYRNKVIFSNLSFSIGRGSFTTILGNNGAGKSTLVKVLAGLIKYRGCIYISNVLFDKKSVSSIRKRVGFVFENLDSCLISEMVVDCLIFPLQGLDCSSDYIYHRVNEVSKFLGISGLLNKCCVDLNYFEKVLVSIGCALVLGPDLLVLDCSFSKVDDFNKNNIFKLLQKINHDYGITILNFTNDIDESIYGDDILILNNGTVAIHGNKDSVYRNNKLLSELGFDLPFMVSLSNKLSYYDLLDDVIYNMEDMVDLLWK